MIGYIDIHFIHCEQKCKKLKHKSIRVQIQTKLEKEKLFNQFVLLIAVIVLFYIYNAICRSVFSLVQCRELGSLGFFLFDDLDTPCYTPSYYAWVIGVSIPGYLLYVFGIPLFLILTLYGNRYQLTDSSTRQYLGVLYKKY